MTPIHRAARVECVSETGGGGGGAGSGEFRLAFYSRVSSQVLYQGGGE